ncbi:MAG TPA: hypothetical protein VGJ28_25575 [Micromonosporaceae bacterium]|jgi:pimeloyl-ACP methyl ester carboxylesterase
MRNGRLATLLIVVLLAAGCGSTPTPRTGRSPAASTAPDPITADGCSITLPEQVIAVEGVRIALLGSGPRAVVLSDESDENLCSWLPYAATLVHAGYRVVVWDYWNDPVADLKAVVQAVRGRGAHSVVLLGASEGAKASLIAAATIEPPVTGVVSLSAEESLQGTDVPAAVTRLRVPVLLLTAHDDAYGSADAGPEILKAMAGTDKRLIVVPGADHGTALLTHASVRADIGKFLAV